MFVSFPWHIYADDPYWAPPLVKHVLASLDTHKHPYWSHAKRMLFLAEKDGRTAGRICAHIDHNYLAHWNTRMGSFGFFECIDDIAVARELFSAAAAWLKKYDMQSVRGPMNPSSVVGFGFREDPPSDLPTFLMSHNPPYYIPFAEACGFSVARRLYAYEKDCKLSPTPDPIYRYAARVKRNPRLSIKRASLAHFDNFVHDITEIYNDSWADHWAYSPVSYDEMLHDFSALKPFWREEMSIIVYYDGIPAGMTICVPSINELLVRLNGRLNLSGLIKAALFRKRFTRCRSILLGFKKQFQGLGLPALVYCEAEPFIRETYSYVECSWIHEDDTDMQAVVKALGMDQCATYAVMERQL
jgi:hypothetical protein